MAGSQFTASYRDGSFNTARFNQPLGLTVSDDGTRLFVADSLNNRIRVIHLDQNNEVGTIAGQSVAGNSDGPLTLAQFNEPRGVLYLPGDHLAVNDFGNQSLRFVDLKTGTVTTYRGGPIHFDGSDVPNPGATPAPALHSPVSLSGIKDIAYLPTAHAILFTQPDAAVLNALNLETGQMIAVLKDNIKLPHPSALWVQENKIYVADRDLQSVYSMDLKNNEVTNIQSAGTPVDKVLSLCSSDNILYGLLKRNGYPAERFMVNGRYSEDVSNDVVRFNNARGEFIPADQYLNETIRPNSPWVGFVPDPLDKRKFFFSIPNMDVIVSLRDIYWPRGINTIGITGANYPAEKPKNTYRIMLIGDCRTQITDGFIFPTDSHPITTGSPVGPDNMGLAPEVEHELNFQAALDDNPMNYEFFTAGHHGDVLFWAPIEVPAKAKNLDIDQLIIFSPNLDQAAFAYYFLYNLTPDGIPQSPPDPEYVLKPPLERIPDGLPRKFYDYCKKHDLVKIQGKDFVWENEVYTDPNLHDMILEFWGKPWEVLDRKLSNIKTSGGKPVRLLILFGYEGQASGEDYHPEMFKEVADRFKIPYFDLNPYLDALNLPYSPTGGGHLDPGGASFYAKLWTQVFKKEKLIPWPIPEKTPAP